MDYRFTFRRKRPAAAEVQEQKRIELDTRRRMRGLAFGMTIPLSLAAGPLGGYFIGTWLDRHNHTQYWVAVFVLLGTVAGIKMVIDMLIRLGRD